jgi:hypothetical protein
LSFQHCAGTAVFSSEDEAGYTLSLSKTPRQALLELIEELPNIPNI